MERLGDTRPGQSCTFVRALWRRLVIAATPHGVDGRRLRRALGEVAHLCRGDLLDLGCGAKPYADLVAGHVRWHVGVDWYSDIDVPSTFRVARARATDVCADLGRQYYPFADGVFDTVLCTQVLEHLSDPFAAFDEIARVLRPGGVLVLSTNLVYPEHQVPHDYFRFTRYGLELLAQRAGLRVVQIRATSGAWSALGAAIEDTLPRRSLLADACFALLLQPLYRCLSMMQLLWPLSNLTTTYVLVAAKSAVPSTGETTTPMGIA